MTTPQEPVDWRYAMQMATDHLIAAEEWQESDLVEGIAIGSMHYSSATAWTLFAQVYAEGYERFGRG